MQAPETALRATAAALAFLTRVPVGRRVALDGEDVARGAVLFDGRSVDEEDRRGLPFVGRSGDLLGKIIAAMDEQKLIPGVSVTREAVYIANVLKCRPPENRNPLPHEIDTCSPHLRRQYHPPAD